MASKEGEEKCSNTKTGEETLALEKKRSKSRRVSFAETTAVHLFFKDEDCETPPEVEDSSNARLLRSESDEIRDLLASDDDDSDGGNDDDDNTALQTSFLRPLESPSPGSFYGSATSNDEDNFFGPVSADFIRPGRLSDSAVSDDNHDVTMDSTAFSMHFRSLARSDSGGEFKTPTVARLAFGERTSGQTSTTTSGEDLMVLTASRKHISGSFLADTVNHSGNSDDMSVVGENPRKYNYGELPPELDVLFVEDSKDKGASLTSPIECSNSIKYPKVNAGSGLHQNGVERLDISNRDVDALHVSDSKGTSYGIVSAVHADIVNESDGIPVTLSDDQSKALILLTDVMPVDKDDEARKGAVDSSEKFQSPPLNSQSSLNHDQPIVGSVSSLLAKRKHIFRVSPKDKLNLVVSEKKFCGEGSKHVSSASLFEKGVSRLKRLEDFQVCSASKAEGNASRIRTSESVSSSLIKSQLLKKNSKDIFINHLVAPVVCLDKQFSNVAEDDGKFQTMGRIGKYDVKTLVGAQSTSCTEAKNAELSSLSATLCFPDKSIEFSGSDVSPLALSTGKISENCVSRSNYNKETLLFSRSDCSVREMTFNDLKHNRETGVFKSSAFSPETNLGRKVSASPLYQGSIFKNLNQQAESCLNLDQLVKLKKANDRASWSENNSSLLIERKDEGERSSSHIKTFETSSQGMQDEESMFRNLGDFPVMSTCLQDALNGKATDSGKLVITRANVETGTVSAMALPIRNMKPVTGSFPTSAINPKESPIKVPESSNVEISCRLLQKPCLADDSNMHNSVGNTVLTPKSDHLTSKHDETNRHLLKPLNSSNDHSSSLKRKLFDNAEEDDDEIISFQHKQKLCKDLKCSEGDGRGPHSIGGDATTRDWVDVFTSFCGMIKLLPSSIDKLDLTQIRTLNDVLPNLEKMRSYELLHRGMRSQKAFETANYSQTKRLVCTKLLLYKTLYQRAKLQLMHLEREKLLDQVRQLDSRVEGSKALISSCHNSSICGQEDVEIDCLARASSPIDLDRSLVAEIPSLRKELEVSEGKIKNLHSSFHTYIKVMKELTCTETAAHVKKIIRKRVACQSLQSEFQLCQVWSIQAIDGKPNILFDYCGVLSQRFFVKSTSTYCLYISNTLNNIKISRMFPGIDAYAAFSFVLCGGANLAYSGFGAIAQEIQKTSSLLHTLIDVVEEVELAMIELRNLTGANFLQPSAGKLDLRLCFTDFNSGTRVALSIDITCLKWGIYPSQVLPYEVQGRMAKKQESSQSLLDDVESAMLGVRYGYMRILSLSRCVSRTIQANHMS